MKSLLLALTIVSIFSGCRSNGKTNKEATAASVILVDSSNLAPLPDGAKRVVVENRAADGSTTVTTTTTTANKATPVAKKDPVASVPQATVPAPEAAKKKGWSARAKGAAIGGVGGAAAGAIISKNKVGGAVIGGAIGAGGGYIIGNEIDRNKQKP